MKYGVNLMVWTTRVGKEQDALLGRIQEWGFDGVELFLSPEEPADIPWVKRTLDHLKLERTSCSVLPRQAHLVSGDPEVRARGVDYLGRCVERTIEMGGSLICGPIYAGLGVMTGSHRTEEEWKRAVEGLRSVARRAEKLGATLCIEPLNRFETYFLNTLQDASRLVHEIGAPNVRIHFDTFHANIEEKQPAVARWQRILDTSTFARTTGAFLVPGTSIGAGLCQFGYNGWLTIESFAKPEPELASAASIWRDVANSGDELALQGLQFIKNLAGQPGVH